MNKVAIIPARGGSKRLPGKNIREFCGKPMIAWSIEAAKASGCFDRIVVSTDDPEVAAVAEAWGGEVPFLRPEELADDYTGTSPVVRHGLQWLIDHGQPADLVCCLYATAPFVLPEDLLKGLALLTEYGACYAFSVTTFPYPIQRALRITRSGGITMVSPEYSGARSQDLEEAWHDAGQFYWGTANAWLGRLPVFGEQSVPVCLPRYRVQDIDTPEDWERAQWLFRAMSGAKGQV